MQQNLIHNYSLPYPAGGRKHPFPYCATVCSNMMLVDVLVPVLKVLLRLLLPPQYSGGGIMSLVEMNVFLVKPFDSGEMSVYDDVTKSNKTVFAIILLVCQQKCQTADSSKVKSINSNKTLHEETPQEENMFCIIIFSEVNWTFNW